MRAIAVTEFGGPEALEEIDLPEPHAGPREVRIRVQAAAVNPTDTNLRSGAYGDGGHEGPWVPGADLAGVVDEVGPDVVGRSVGDRVIAVPVPMGPHGGAYADHVVVPAAAVVRLPDGIDVVPGSTLLMNALTARVVLEKLGLRPGQTIAVTGAAGAFGGYVVQLAKDDGLTVVADASEDDEELVRGLGADHVVRRGDDVADRIRDLVPDGVDGLADGAVLTEKVVAAIKDGGAMATIRGWGGPAVRDIRVHPVLVFDHAERTELLARLRDQAEDGTLTLRVAQVFPAEKAAEAHRVLEAGGVRGRLVLDFS
jgi:NADPH:quinone reductase-like Zn-dependent oxidoreductase